MDFIIFLASSVAFGALLGFLTGVVFPSPRHGALWCFLACVALFWVYCSFYGGSLLDAGSVGGLGYVVFMRLFYGALIGCLAPPAYYLGRLLVTRIRKPRPPA